MATNHEPIDFSKRDITNDQAPATGNEPSGDMDDTTGSNGGSTEERFSGDNYTDDSEDSADSSFSRPSRSDTSRVDGPGISGGTGDTDSSQSGGRSQY